jgi:hypothetical protein
MVMRAAGRRLGWGGVALILLAALPVGQAVPARAQECAEAARHPEWIFCHDFEAPDAAQFDRYWDDVYDAGGRMALVGENPAGVAGARSMRLRVVNETDTAFENGVTAGPTKFLGREVDWDTIFYRRYLRFGADFHQGNFMHLGGLIACHASLYPWSCLGHAGQRPAGDRIFSTTLEPWSDYQRQPWPGRWGFYSYYYRMHMDCGLPGPDDCYGDMFAPEAPAYLSRGAWHVMELSLTAGTPGQADGSQTFWIDGRKVFTASGIAWRTVAELRPNEFGAYLYIHNNPAHTTNILDVDNVLLSRRYIGPAACADGAHIFAPCACGGAADPDDPSNIHDVGFCCRGRWQAAVCESVVPSPSPSPTPSHTATPTTPTAPRPPSATPTRRPATPTPGPLPTPRPLHLPWLRR